MLPEMFPLLCVDHRAGEMIPEVEGTRPWGPRGKGSPSVSKSPKLPIQLLQLLKNSPREVKRAFFRYIPIGPPGSHPGNGIHGARRGRSLPVPPPVSPAMVDQSVLETALIAFPLSNTYEFTFRLCVRHVPNLWECDH